MNGVVLQIQGQTWEEDTPSIPIKANNNRIWSLIEVERSD